MGWSAKQYTKFEDERTRPVRDLVAAIPDGNIRLAVDLGCGPGNSTEVLAARFSDAKIIGMDNDEDMIKAARKRLPELQFDLADIETWDSAEPLDVILANAVFQWVPHHDVLFPHLIDRLTDGGSLAVQMPDNQDEPSHRIMRETAADGPWADKLASAKRTARNSAEWYYEHLRPLCSKVDIWRTIYHHPLAGGAEAIVEWFKGSSLRPLLAPLNETDQKKFLDRYTAAIEKAYPALPDGTVLLPFPRLFIVATR